MEKYSSDAKQLVLDLTTKPDLHSSEGKRSAQWAKLNREKLGFLVFAHIVNAYAIIRGKLVLATIRISKSVTESSISKSTKRGAAQNKG